MLQLTIVGITFWVIVFGIPDSKFRRAIDFLGLLTQDCLMLSTFPSDVPIYLKISVSQHFPFLWTVSTNDSEPYHLVLFLLDVTFATYVALLQLISVLLTIKQTEAFCCMVHISPDTDSHWEVKLAGLGNSDGPALCTSIDGLTDKSISTSLTTRHQLSKSKTYSLSPRFKLQGFRYV
jgi:hypothetical protein